MKYEGIYDYEIRFWHKFEESNDPEKLVGVTNKREFIDLVYSQLIDEFGVSSIFETLFYKRADLIRWEIAKLEGDRSADTFIMSLESDIDFIEEDSKKIEINIRKRNADLRRSVKTTFGYSSLDNMTIYEFYNDVHELMKMSDEREKNEIIKQLAANG